MNKLILNLIILVAFSFIVNCSNKTVNNKHDKIFDFCLAEMKRYYKVDTAGWSFDNNYLRNYNHVLLNATNYFMKKTEDSLWLHVFEIDIYDEDTSYVPWELHKRYENSGLQHIISYGKGLDTLYYYKATLFGDMHKIFITGKYYYEYENHELSNNQRKYFLNHYDSLLRVKGNKLPELPDVID